MQFKTESDSLTVCEKNLHWITFNRDGESYNGMICTPFTAAGYGTTSGIDVCVLFNHCRIYIMVHQFLMKNLVEIERKSDERSEILKL